MLAQKQIRKAKMRWNGAKGFPRAISWQVLQLSLVVSSSAFKFLFMFSSVNFRSISLFLFRFHSQFKTCPSQTLKSLDHNQKLSRGRTIMTNSADTIEECKASAAKQVVDDSINADCIVGIGSGSTMSFVLDRLVYRCEEKGYSIKCIPTSYQSRQLINDHKLPITDLDCNPVIDVTIDGADEVDENFVAIKGGGACLAQEKVVAYAAKRFVVVADYRKDSRRLGSNWSKGIPIEVLPMACNAVRHRMCQMFGLQEADIVIRIGKEKAGPVITDNGNIVLDWKFNPSLMSDLSSIDWKSLADKIKLIPGVVETGIFACMIKEAYFGQLDGTVIKRVAE